MSDRPIFGVGAQSDRAALEQRFLAPPTPTCEVIRRGFVENGVPAVRVRDLSIPGLEWTMSEAVAKNSLRIKF